MANKPYKAKRVKIDKKYSMVIYAVTLILAIGARTTQLMHNMNFESGKYIDPSPEKNYPFWILLIGLALIAAVLIVGKSRDKAIKSCILVNPMRLRAERLNKKFSPLAGAMMFIMAGLIAFDVILTLSSVARKNLDISTEDDPVFIFAGVPLLKWLIYAFSIITLITFISSGVNILKGEGLSKGNCVFLMFFPIWKLLEIFAMFSESQLIGVYSEKVYIMLTSMVSSMFFIYTARLFVGAEKSYTRLMVCFSGYAASLIAAVSVVPRYIMYFVLSYTEREGMGLPETSDIGIALVAVAIVAVFWSTYVYRVMPKLNLTGKRRWKGVSVTDKEKTMTSLEDELKNK